MNVEGPIGFGAENFLGSSGWVAQAACSDGDLARFGLNAEEAAGLEACCNAGAALGAVDFYAAAFDPGGDSCDAGGNVGLKFLGVECG